MANRVLAMAWPALLSGTAVVGTQLVPTLRRTVCKTPFTKNCTAPWAPGFTVYGPPNGPPRTVAVSPTSAPCGEGFGLTPRKVVVSLATTVCVTAEDVLWLYSPEPLYFAVTSNRPPVG